MSLLLDIHAFLHLEPHVYDIAVPSFRALRAGQTTARFSKNNSTKTERIVNRPCVFTRSEVKLSVFCAGPQTFHRFVVRIGIYVEPTAAKYTLTDWGETLRNFSMSPDGRLLPCSSSSMTNSQTEDNSAGVHVHRHMQRSVLCQPATAQGLNPLLCLRARLCWQVIPISRSPTACAADTTQRKASPSTARRRCSLLGGDGRGRHYEANPTSGVV